MLIAGILLVTRSLSKDSSFGSQVSSTLKTKGEIKIV